MKIKETVIYHGVELEVTFDYYAGWRSNDYEQPDDEEEIDIYEIKVGGVDIYDIIDEIPCGITNIEQLLKQRKNENNY